MIKLFPCRMGNHHSTLQLGGGLEMIKLFPYRMEKADSTLQLRWESIELDNLAKNPIGGA